MNRLMPTTWSTARCLAFPPNLSILISLARPRRLLACPNQFSTQLRDVLPSGESKIYGWFHRAKLAYCLGRDLRDGFVPDGFAALTAGDPDGFGTGEEFVRRPLDESPGAKIKFKLGGTF